MFVQVWSDAFIGVKLLLKAMAFARAPRMQTLKKDATPGPGAYSPHLRASAPAWSFAARPMSHKEKATRPIVQKQMSEEEGALRRMEISEITLGAEIGRGGLASVYLSQVSGKQIACKLWRYQEGMQSKEKDDRAALEREAHLLHKLSHENVVRIGTMLIDNGKVAGFSMERLGPSLHAALQSHTLTRLRLAAALAPTCAALAFIHRNLVAHTDAYSFSGWTLDFFGGFSY